ncbi:hypothetical protein NAC44_02935 [Allorhizobium sp. BGMRC 0089]|uniref:hypothetical protein n=1 Tax=Allorhizobium sonneratiae TaxID=2934936 RepID=UPI0020342B5B|nr:hypothetical protein [Allorhizobium sonneratiae]MCM2291282.1 hypothetical protein [Allorhizobium sonneratiae]
MRFSPLILALFVLLVLAAPAEAGPVVVAIVAVGQIVGGTLTIGGLISGFGKMLSQILRRDRRRLV